MQTVHLGILGCCLVLLQGCATAPLDTQNQAFVKKYSAYHYADVSVVIQSRPESCGLACLSAVAQNWDILITEENLLDRYGDKLDHGGSYLTELKTVAQAEGLKAFALAFTPNAKEQLLSQLKKGRPLIAALRLPAHRFLVDKVPILRLTYGFLIQRFGIRKDHYVVVFGYADDENSVLIMDPELGYYRLSWKEFSGYWENMNYTALLCGK